MLLADILPIMYTVDFSSCSQSRYRDLVNEILLSHSGFIPPFNTKLTDDGISNNKVGTSDSFQTHVEEPSLLFRAYLNKSNILILQNWRGINLNIRILGQVSSVSGPSCHYHRFSFYFVILAFISLSNPDLEERKSKTFIKKDQPNILGTEAIFRQY